jgi:hypothetical protein
VKTARGQLHDLSEVWHDLCTLPTAASPSNTSLTLLLGFGCADASAIVVLWMSRRGSAIDGTKRERYIEWYWPGSRRGSMAVYRYGENVEVALL